VQHVGAIIAAVAYVAALFDDPTLFEHCSFHQDHRQHEVALVHFAGGAPEQEFVAVELFAEFVSSDEAFAGT
jgi:hypothetical protein